MSNCYSVHKPDENPAAFAYARIICSYSYLVPSETLNISPATALFGASITLTYTSKNEE